MGAVFSSLVAGLLLAGLNYYLYSKARRMVRRWRKGAEAERWVRRVRAGFLLINAPYVVLMLLWLAGGGLHQVPRPVLRVFFYPFFAWVAMLVALIFLALPAEIAAGIVHLLRRLFPPRRPVTAVVLARRNFLAATAWGVPAALFAVFTKGVYGSPDLEVSPTVRIPVRGLPAAFHGITITQLSDFHAGAFMREAEMARVVEVANGLRPELVVITGDILDASLDLLPETQRALSRLRAPLGVFGILGNHDYYADRRGPGYPGCQWIVEGMRAAGVRMLRSRHARLRQGRDELLIVGLDWTGMTRGNPNIYSSAATRAALRRALDGYQGDAPRILLAHHPHAFNEAAEFQAALTLAGHTHGGGQVVVAEHNGRPLALGSAVFRYVKGLYQEGDRYLYVNRGLGFVALPIRINCPPEIARFQLVKT
jgi:hypothetical protein